MNEAIRRRNKILIHKFATVMYNSISPWIRSKCFRAKLAQVQTHTLYKEAEEITGFYGIFYGIMTV